MFIGQTIGIPSGGRVIPNGATTLLGSETDGLAVDFTDNSMVIRDTATPANAYAGAPFSKLTFARASTAWLFNSSGLLTSASSGTHRIDYGLGGTAPLGLLMEEARTNVVLHNRDLTNAAWVSTNITPLKDQVGIDGVANSASSITATAGNGTCLQSITLGSSARFQTTYIKRLVGSGTINMTMDNGTTWTAVSPTSSWTRVSIPTQTLANPTVGFRIVTSGDSIAIDCVQNENGATATSPIITTTASVTRAADTCSIATSLFPYSATASSIFVRASTYSARTSDYLFSLDGAGTGFIEATIQAGPVLNVLMRNSAGSNVVSISNSITADTPFRTASAFAADNCAVSHNGGAVTTDSTTASLMPATATTLRIGNSANPTNNRLHGHIKQIVYVNRRVSNADLVSWPVAS